MNAPLTEKRFEPISAFERLAAINVNQHTEKKNGLTYLSWAWAVDQLLRADPSANWSFGEPGRYGKDTWMVNCTVTAFNIPRTIHLPVMDHRNKAISDPDAFQFNTAMMRCLVKAIALHGLGLYIYAGEDLPDGEDKTPAQPQQAAKGPITPTTGAWEEMDQEQQTELTDIALNVIAMIDSADVAGAVKYLEQQGLAAEEKTAIWTRFDSKQRAAMKKAAKPTTEELANTP